MTEYVFPKHAMINLSIFFIFYYKEEIEQKIILKEIYSL